MISLETAQRNYDANMKSIPWNADIAKNFRTSNNSVNGTINANLPIYMNLVEQQARNVNGAAAQRSNARSAVDGAINALKGIPLGIDTRIAQIDIGGIQNKIKVVEDAIAAEKSKQKKSEELLEIRKEQTTALEKKYSANLHSSWLGLWRPLKDNTHVGLNVASAMFGLLGLLTIAYLAYTQFVAPVGGASEIASNLVGSSSNLSGFVQEGAKNLMANFRGGFRFLKNSK